MKLTDENGNEFTATKLIDEQDGYIVIKMSPVQKGPKVIDWSRVHPDVPVQFLNKQGEFIRYGFLDRYDGKVFREQCADGKFICWVGATLESGKWVAWFGGDEPPVPEGVMVAIALRTGETMWGDAQSFYLNWVRACAPGEDPKTDIIAFRVTGLADGYCYSE